MAITQKWGFIKGQKQRQADRMYAVFAAFTDRKLLFLRVQRHGRWNYPLFPLPLSTPRLPLASPILGALLWVLSIAGCAYSYIDDQGVHHTVGLVKMSVQTHDDHPDMAGTSIEVTSVGVAGHHTPLMSSFTIGYSREQITGLKNDVLLLDDGDETGTSAVNANTPDEE